MLGKLASLVKDVLHLSRDLKQAQDEIKSLQGDVRNLSDKMHLLVFELQRTRDQMDSDRQAAEKERGNLLLRLENAFLKFDRRLPMPSKETGDD